MKNKVGIIVLLVGGLFMLSSCVATENLNPKPETTVSSILGKDGIPQPEWVYKTVKSEDLHYESGYGKMSNQQNSIKRATVEAKNKIAEWVNTKVTEVLTTYINDAGSGDNRQSLDAMESISVQVAEASLSGVTTKDMWIDAEGGVYVLCSIPVDNIEKSFLPASERITRLFEKNEAADAANEKMKALFSQIFLD